MGESSEAGRVSQRGLGALLDSLSPQYPFGVPRRVLSEASRRAAAHSQENVADQNSSRPSAEGSAAPAGNLAPEAHGKLSRGLVIVGAWSRAADRQPGVTPASKENFFEGAEGEVLKAAIEKGLKLSLSEVLVVWHPGAEKLSALLEFAAAPRAVLVLGARVVEGAGSAAAQPETALAASTTVENQLFEALQSSLDEARTALIASPSLLAVRTSEAAKREFWADLKKALKALT